MMEINRNNYEIFFIDYFDGNLSKKQEEELMRFISINNDLEEEFYEFNDIKITPENYNPAFTKESLKRNSNDFVITKQNFGENCIAKIEGDLTKNNEEIFEKYLEYNPEKEKTFNLYQKTILEPELNIVFEEKSKIKRHFIGARKPRRTIYQYISGAAAVIIIISFFLNINSGDRLEILKNNASFLNFKNVREVAAPEESFSIVKTERTSIVSQSTAHLNTNKKNNKYQYVDHKKAIFVSDFLSNLSNYTTEVDEDFVVALKTNKTQPELTNNTPLAALNNEDNNEQSIFFISPKQVSVVSGELNSENFLNSVIENLNIEIENNNSESKDNKITFWDIAETGIKSYGLITGKKVELEKKYDNNGRLASLDINSKKFGFSKKFKK